MRRSQNRSTGSQSGAQASQPGTGNVSGTGGNVGSTGANAGATSTGLRDQPGSTTETTTSTSYARDTTTQPAYREDRGYREDTRERTGLSGGGMSILAGFLAFLWGLAMIVRNHFYPPLPGYAYTTNVDYWGWIMLGLGILLFAAGSSRLLDLPFSRPFAIAIATLTAIGAFVAAVYAPLFGFIVVAVSVVALWALLRERRRGEFGSRSRM
jgi:hypothetical protein